MPCKKRKVELSSDEWFKRAYMYYERNENQRALDTIAKASGAAEEVRFIELRAQLLYRVEQYEECLELLTKILRDHSDDFDDWRRANVVAVHALLEAKRRGDAPAPTAALPFAAVETFEGIYNAACFRIAQNDFREAVQLLDDAAAKCKRTLAEDGFKESEIQEEVAVIHAQKAYALQRLGLVDEALAIYKDIQANNVADKNTRAVVLNNVLAAEKAPVDLARLKTARLGLASLAEKGRWKLIPAQKRIVLSNLEVLKSKTLLAGALAAAGKADAFQEIVTGKLGKRKRKRKPRLPKNYDPNVPPDPERWLPRQERSAYRKKLNRKYKDRDIGRGTQGASAASGVAASSSSTNNAMDFSGKQPGTSSVEASPKPAEGPRQQRPGAAAKKPKKKKGGTRW